MGFMDVKNHHMTVWHDRFWPMAIWGDFGECCDMLNDISCDSDEYSLIIIEYHFHDFYYWCILLLTLLSLLLFLLVPLTAISDSSSLDEEFTKPCGI